MHKRITFRNMGHSDAMEQYINKHLEKIERFLKNEPTPIYIDMVIDAAKTHEHPHVELRIKSQHYNLVSEYEHVGVPVYEAIDHVLRVMKEELLKQKDKEVGERKVRGRHDDFKKQR